MKGSIWKVSLGIAASLMIMAGPSARSQVLTPKNQAAVVMVGHSLINFQMPSLVEGLAVSKGLPYARATQIILGAPLRLNLENCRGTLTALEIQEDKFKYSCSAIEAGSAIGPYDTLVLTDSNGGIDLTRANQRTDEAIADYVDILHSRNASGRVLLFTTWEATSRAGYGADWPARQAADLALYEEMARASTALARARGRNVTVEVIPVDIALADLILKAERGEVAGVGSRTEIFYDEVHMNSLGNYFVACVVFSAIMNRTPEGGARRILAGDGGVLIDLPAATATALQRIAWEVVSTYRSRSGAAAVAPKAPGSFTVH